MADWETKSSLEQFKVCETQGWKYDVRGSGNIHQIFVGDETDFFCGMWNASNAI